MKVHEVPEAAASARGKAIVNLIQIPSDRKLAGVVPVRDFAEGRYVLMVTSKGVIKKTSLADFRTSARTASTPSTSTKAMSCSTWC